MKKIAFALLACCTLNNPVNAVDGIAFTGGHGHDANMAAVSLTWYWEKRWFTEGDWHLGGYWEFTGTAWKGDRPSPEKELYAIGIAPVFRLQRSAPSGWLNPYAEAGIGAYQFSGRRVHGSLSMGTRFEFGNHVGLGVTFGDQQQYDLSYRFQHFSNAGITSENPWVNFNEIRFGYHF